MISVGQVLIKEWNKQLKSCIYVRYVCKVLNSEHECLFSNIDKPEAKS